MKLVTTKLDADDSADPTSWRVALVLPNGRLLRLVALARLAPDILAEEIDTLDLATVVALDPSGDAIARALEVAGPTAVQAASTSPEESRLAAAVPRPTKVVGVGYNYLDHIREQGLEKPSRPTLFSKFASSVVADGSPIRHPAGTHALDLEAELAVVIGKRAHGVAVAEAARCIGGYCVANDVTARDWQGQAPALRPGEQGDGQWLRAKGSDTFLPLGPVFITPDELDAVPGATRDGRGLAVRSWLTKASGPDTDREIQMQDGNTSDLIFGVPELISIISAEVTLDPGDIILTGTPSGVGVWRRPPVFMEPGDLVRVEVAGVGSMKNPVADPAGHVPSGSPADRFLRGLVPA